MPMQKKNTSNTTKRHEWWGWFGSVSWLFFMMYGHDNFIFGDLIGDESTWLPFFFMAAFAASIAAFGWCFGHRPNELSKVAFYLTPVAIAITAVFAILPPPFDSVLYIIAPIFMAPSLVRRVYGIIHTSKQNKRLTRYMSGIAVCVAAFTIWMIIDLPKETAFIVPALLALPAWFKIRREVSLPERAPPKARFGLSKKLMVLFALAMIMFIWLENEQGVIHTLFLAAAEQTSAVLFTILGFILPPIGFLIFAVIADKGHERTGFICGMGLFLIGLLFAYLPNDADGWLLLPLFFADGLGGAYTEFFILTVPLFLFDQTPRPVFIASLGVILNLVSSALGWKLSLWMPEPFLYLDAPLIVSCAVLTVVFIVLAFILFEHHREKSLAAALYALVYGGIAIETPEPESQPVIPDELFSPNEKNIALLLIEGTTQREIVRKLHIPTAEVGQCMDTLREKIGAQTDPAISAASAKYKLTGRETDMLSCLREGKTNLDIADEYYLSEQTVKNYIHSLMKKLPVENRAAIPTWLDEVINN